jgi:putative transcriptional regulator
MTMRGRKSNVDVDGDLTGKLLVASPAMDSRAYFFRSVIYVLESSEHGSVGIVINNPLDKLKEALLVSLEGASAPLKLSQAYVGGPVEMERGHILYLDQYNGSDNTHCVKLGSDIKILKNVTRCGRNQGMLVLGHCGWDGGQLEEEIKHGYWIVLPPNKKIIFGNKDQDKWDRCISTLKIDLTCYIDTVGNG